MPSFQFDFEGKTTMTTNFHTLSWMMKKTAFFTCLILNFLYFIFQGCTEPQELMAPPNQPPHLTHVPQVLNLRGGIGFTVTGKRQVLLTWEFDTLNSNIRSWDINRSTNDTSAAAFIPLQIVRKPSSGYPYYIDSTGTLQFTTPDSVELYYKVIPNGLDNFVGQASDILHVILRKI